MFRYKFVGEQESAVTAGEGAPANSSGDDPDHDRERRRLVFEERCESLRQQTVTGGVRTVFKVVDVDPKSPATEHECTRIPVFYADYTASGQALGSIESEMQKQVLPLYGNTHTLTTATSRQSTYFRAEAKNIVRHALNCCPINDAVIFTGNGSTGAANKFKQLLEAEISAEAAEAVRREEQAPGRGEKVDEEDAAGAPAATTTTCGDCDVVKPTGYGHLAENSNLAAKLTDNIRQFFKEDRWGSCECTLCGVRLKNEACFRAHLQTTLHRENESRNFGSRTASSGVSAIFGVKATKQPRKTIFFLDPFAHHSSSLPFRELAAKYPATCSCVEINAHLDPAEFEEELLNRVKHEVTALTPPVNTSDSDQIYLATRPPPPRLVAVLSAGSNVTGVLRNVPFLTQRLHKLNCVVAFDFAASLAHVRVDLNPRNCADAAVDAAFFSPHKLLGGPGCSGVLVVKKQLLTGNAVPTVPGGGTVFYVSDKGQSYIQNHEEREEAGTPNVLADVKCGLVFKLHHALSEFVFEKEQRLRKRFLEKMKGCANFELLGGGLVSSSSDSCTEEDFDEQCAVQGKTKTNSESFVTSTTAGTTSSPRPSVVPIFSFLIRHKKRYLHYNFVCAVLNDLFGIQARGGCACAGPYAQKLLGMSDEVSDQFDAALKRYGAEVLRPGFCRISLHYTMREADVDFLADCLRYVSENAADVLLPLYSFDVDTGEWQHEDDDHETRRVWLGNFDLFGAHELDKPAADTERKDKEKVATFLPKTLPRNLQPQLESFRDFEEKIIAHVRIPTKNRRYPILDGRVANMLWFSLPQDVVASTEHAKQNEVSQLHTIFEGDNGGRVPERPEESCFRIPGNNSELAAGLAEGKMLKDADVSTASCSTTISPTAVDRTVATRQKTSAQEHPQSSEQEVLDLSEIVGAEAVDFSSGYHDDPTTVVADRQAAADRRAAADHLVESHHRLLRKYASSALHPKIPKTFRALVGQAMKDFEMIRPGDKVLIGLSGGKDSLSLLHVLLHLQKCSPIKFELACATVNPETPEYDPSPLKEYLHALNVRYHFLSKPLIELAKQHMNPKKVSICSFCARMKRGMLYTCMREFGYNVLVLGQHLDDLAESFLMSGFHNGALRTMKAHYVVQSEDLRVIRPLVYVREKVMAKFAEENKLPVIADNCPACFAVPKERHRVKLLLAKEEFLMHDLFSNLLKAMKPLMAVRHAKVDEDEFVVRNGVGKSSVAGPSATAEEEEDGLAEMALTKCGLGSGDACGLPGRGAMAREGSLGGA
eukprot:g2962.t1